MQTSVPHTCLKKSSIFFTYEEKYFDIIPGLGSNWRRLTRAHSFIQVGPDSQTHFNHVKVCMCNSVLWSMTGVSHVFLPLFCDYKTPQ